MMQKNLLIAKIRELLSILTLLTLMRPLFGIRVRKVSMLLGEFRHATVLTCLAVCASFEELDINH